MKKTPIKNAKLAKGLAAKVPALQAQAYAPPSAMNIGPAPKGPSMKKPRKKL